MKEISPHSSKYLNKPDFEKAYKKVILSIDILPNPLTLRLGIPRITPWVFSFHESAYVEELPHQHRGRSLQRRYLFPCAPR